MNGTENFKSVIQNYLNQVATKDSLFAKNLSKENKNIDECINYILSEVQKSKCNAFADDEIFNMAIHYYDEDDIKNIKPIKASGFIAHSSQVVEQIPIVEKPKEVPVITLKQPKKATAIDNNQVSIFDFEGI